MFPILRQRFQLRHPALDVEPTYGSSGQLFAQISNGAPFDLFLSADRQLVQKLAGSGPPRFSSAPFEYATGQLALWVSADSSLNLTTDLRDVLQSLRSAKIALANPDHAPYGRAAREVLQNLHLDQELAGQLVYADNVAQALQFADTGGAAAAFVALPLVVQGPASSRGRWAHIPPHLHSPLRQGGLVLRLGPGESAAHEFARWLLLPEARVILRDHGFLTTED